MSWSRLAGVVAEAGRVSCRRCLGCDDVPRGTSVDPPKHSRIRKRYFKLVSGHDAIRRNIENGHNGIFRCRSAWGRSGVVVRPGRERPLASQTAVRTFETYVPGNHYTWHFTRRYDGTMELWLRQEYGNFESRGFGVYVNVLHHGYRYLQFTATAGDSVGQSYSLREK